MNGYGKFEEVRPSHCSNFASFDDAICALHSCTALTFFVPYVRDYICYDDLVPLFSTG